MKRLIPAGLVVAFIVSALVFVFPTATNGQGAGLVSSVLSRMEKNRQSLKTLRSGIHVVKYNSQLGVEDKYSGVVIYMPTAGRQAALRIDWSSPAPRDPGGKQQPLHDFPSRIECRLHRRLPQDGQRE
jgi:hypothetical protein